MCQKLSHLLLFISTIVSVSNFGVSRSQKSTNEKTFFSRKLIRSTKKSEKNEDSYFDYKFDGANEYRESNGDEFEKVDCINGSNSSIKIQNEPGRETVLKAVTEPNSESTKTISYNDIKENNDTFLTATNMYSVGSYKDGITKMWSWRYATINQKTEGPLWWKKTYIDKDFYSFDVACSGTLNISLTEIPSNCDYDMRLYRLEDEINANAATLNFDNYEGCSRNSKGQDEYISYSVVPGTYYICVYSYNDQTYDNDNPYKITFEEISNSGTSETSYYIDVGRVENDIGAIWISDYSPFGLSPMTLTDTQARKKFTNYDCYPYIQHLANNYEDCSINFAVLYLWNLQARAYIYAWAQNILNSLYNYNNWANDSVSSFGVHLNDASMAVTVGGTIINTISEATIAETAKAALNSLGFLSSLAGSVISLISFVNSFSLENEFQISRKNLIQYLVNIKAAFEIGTGSNEDQTIMLKFRYHFSEKQYIDWSPRYELGEANMHNEDYVSLQIPGSGIKGTAHGIHSTTDLEKYLRS